MKKQHGKYVYVLVSDGTEYYAEQTLLSIYSLKLREPDAHVEIVTDHITLKNIKGKTKEILSLADEIKEIQISEEFSKVERSRYLKTQLRKYVSGDFLFIDSDTLVNGRLSDLFKLKCDIGAVINRHTSSSDSERLREYLQTIGEENLIGEYDPYFNSGVMLVKDNNRTHRFYEDWHIQWLRDRNLFNIILDQPSMCRTNKAHNFIISELNGKYNCQTCCGQSDRFWKNAKIFHYFATDKKKKFFLNHKEVMEEVRNHGLSQSMKDIIRNPFHKLVVDFKKPYLEDRNLLKIIKRFIRLLIEHKYFVKS